MGALFDKKNGKTLYFLNVKLTLPLQFSQADLNLVGFIPEEIKWLYSLESLDIQNNHLVSNLCAGGGEGSDQVQLTSFRLGQFRVHWVNWRD